MTRGIQDWRRALSFAVLLSAVWSATVLGASPSPSAGPAGGDPRSSGEGPGFVGDPLFAIAAVLAIGLASVAITYLYIRMTAGRTRP